MLEIMWTSVSPIPEAKSTKPVRVKKINQKNKKRGSIQEFLDWKQTVKVLEDNVQQVFWKHSS